MCFFFILDLEQESVLKKKTCLSTVLSLSVWMVVGTRKGSNRTSTDFVPFEHIQKALLSTICRNLRRQNGGAE